MPMDLPSWIIPVTSITATRLETNAPPCSTMVWSIFPLDEEPIVNVSGPQAGKTVKTMKRVKRVMAELHWGGSSYPSPFGKVPKELGLVPPSASEVGWVR